MRVTLMHNAGAGEEDHGAGELVAILERAGHVVRYAAIGEDGWEDALRAPADIVAAAGGDGTIAGVALAMPEGAPPLTVLPLGSANNIARTLGLADRPVAALAAAWDGAPRRPFDLGRARGADGTARFAEAAGGGLFADLLERAEEAPADPSGEEREDHGLTLLRGAIAEAPVHRFTVELDGEDLSGGYLGVEAMNIREIGPNVALAPDADPGDGLVELALVRPQDRAQLLAVVAARLGDRPAPPPRVLVRRGRTAVIGAPRGCPRHLDDDLCGDAAATWEVSLEPGRLGVVAPGA